MKRSGGKIHTKDGNTTRGNDITDNNLDGEEQGDEEKEGGDSDIEWTVDHEAVGKRVAAHFPPVKGNKKGGPGRKKVKTEVSVLYLSFLYPTDVLCICVLPFVMCAS